MLNRKTKQIGTKFSRLCLVLASLVVLADIGTPCAVAQRKVVPTESPISAPHRTRLILKDGSYQLVMSYRVSGHIVKYVSAERGGAEEEIPVDLVDFEATHRWEKQHAPGANPDAQDQPSTIDPELLKEEAERSAMTPIVAPDLRLPDRESVLALDIFRDAPELVPLAQSEGDLNRNTGHNIVKAVINPLSTSHQIVLLKGLRSQVQLHVSEPVIYIRVGDDVPATGGTPLTVDTHGASGIPPSRSGSASSRYVIVRADVRSDGRVLTSFNIGLLGGVRRQEDVVETATELLPGGHWMKLAPRQSLGFGEYALMEVISEKEVNLGVWDFGIHPTAPENRDAIRPEPKRPLTLERRRPE